MADELITRAWCLLAAGVLYILYLFKRYLDVEIGYTTRNEEGQVYMNALGMKIPMSPMP